MTSLPTLRGPRVVVRAFDVDVDVEAFHAWQGDPRVIWWGASPDRATSARLLRERCARGSPPVTGAWAIDVDGAVVGTVFAFDIDDVEDGGDGAGGAVEIGWHLARAAQGRGHAREAAAVLLAHLRSCGQHNIVADIVPVNTASQHIARRLGFVVDGGVTKGGLFHERWRVPR